MDSAFAGYKGIVRNRGYSSLLVAQAMSVFNDNAFRYVLLLLVIAGAGSVAAQNRLVSYANGIFVLPYILFSSYAGQIADRFSKRSVIIAFKLLEVALMSAAALAVYSANIPVMLAVLFVAGTHSTFLAPAKEGILPQMLADQDLSRANGLMQLTVYTMIIAGPVFAGLVRPWFPAHVWAPVAFLIPMALASFLVSLGVTPLPAIGRGSKFQFNAIAEFRRNFREICSSRALLLTVLGIAYFWFLGTIYLQNVLIYGRDLLHEGDRGVTLLNAVVSIGIGLGAVAAGTLSGAQVELGLVPIGSIGLGAFAIDLSLAPHSLANALLGHFLLGVSGGLFIVPLEAFLQQRAGEHTKGRVIAAANILTFSAVFLGSAWRLALANGLGLAPDKILLIMGLMSFAATAYVLTILPEAAIRLCLWLLTHTLYRIEVRGRENLPAEGPALLVSNHSSFVDPFLLGASTQRMIRFLIYRRFYEMPGIHWLAKLMRAIPVSDADPPRQLIAAFREARERLQSGDLVCIFAEGSITRTGNLLPFHRGFERILQNQNVPIIPIHLDRVWGSIFSFERGRFFFKWPRRIPYPVTVSIGRPLPSDSRAFEVRQAVMELGAEASLHRDRGRRPLPEMFVETAKRHWGRFSMADSLGRRLTFGRALAGAMALRRVVLQRCPAEPMIGVLLPPTVPAALLNLAVSMAGKVPVNLNYTASSEALDSAIARCAIKTIFTNEKFLEKVKIVKRPGIVRLDEVAGSISSARKLASLVAARLIPLPVLRYCILPRTITLDSLATVMFSSGSTGIPKGVMLTHRNIVSNIEGIQQVINPARSDCLLGTLPMFHSFGFTGGLWFPAISGFGVVYHTSPLEARKVGELCREYRATIFISTPTFAWEYIRRSQPQDFASLRLCIVGSEKMKPELAEAFRAKFGVQIHEGYGCTELSPVVSVATSGYSHRGHKQVGYKAGSVGHPIPGVAVRIVNPETSVPVGPNHDGMLMVKGPNVMAGYLGASEETHRVIRDGWYITGDMARTDEDGFLSITGRLSRFSKIGGEMVPHLEVEDTLHRVLGATESRLAVTSLSDDQKGERLVVLHTPLEVSLDELLKRMRETTLPRLWLPRRENYFQIQALPVLGSGKLDLRQLKETAQELAALREAAKPIA
jgi:acyl-[acyl-carrier-protein]-phospholipid O-acyltransferase / long-chain-fatty-acid--[acyl-carrier-protein] ligase